MKKNLSTAELLVKKTEESTIWEILELLGSCKDLEEAKEKVMRLLGRFCLA